MTAHGGRGRLALLRSAYDEVSTLLLGLTEADAGRPTGCAGWAVLDLAQHLVFDARRGLLATAAPADALPDTDAVGYWRSWQQSPRDADDDRWRTRVVASVSGGIGPLAAVYAETSSAVLVAASRLDPTSAVRTQGHVLTVEDLLSSLVVETAVHHLDLVVDLDRPGPGAGPLAEARCVLTGLLGRELPVDWDDLTAARRSTGREALTAADRRALGDDAGRFPLLS